MKCSLKWLLYFPGSFLSARATEKSSEETLSSSHSLTSFSFEGQIKIFHPTLSGYSNQTNQDILTPTDFLQKSAELRASRISGFQHFWDFMTQPRELSSATHNHEDKCDSREQVCYRDHALSCCNGKCHGSGCVGHHHKAEHHYKEGFYCWFQTLKIRRRRVSE